MVHVIDMLHEPRRVYLRGVVSIERVVSRALQVGRHGTTKQNAVHLVVDVARAIPEVKHVLGASRRDQCTHSSNVNKMRVFAVLKLGFASKGTSQ